MGLNKTNLQLKKGYAGKLTVGVIAILIILILFISGPANAFVLNINSNKTSVESGEIVEFNLNVDISSSDGTLPVNNITLILDGPAKKECVFDANGNILSGCTGIISIQRTDNTSFEYGYGSYGYGYGYINGKLEYKIKLSTTSYPKGIYHTKLTVLINGHEFSKNGNSLEIKNKQTLTLGGTSSHKLAREEKIIDKNKISVLGGDVYNFTFNDKTNEIIINSITEDSVNLTLKPSGKNFVIKITEPAMIDINKDGEYDMELKAWHIGNNSASIYFKSNSIKDLNKKQKETTSAVNKEPEYYKTEIEQSQKYSIGIYEIVSLILANLIVLMLILIMVTVRKRK